MILILDNGSKYITNLIETLEELGAEPFLESKKAPLSEIETHKYNGMILSGGPLLLDRKIYIEEISDDIASVLDLELPVLGICLGHEIIAEAYAGKIIRQPETTKGKNKIFIIEENDLFRGVGENIEGRKDRVVEVEEHHLDKVGKLPDMFTLLAYSEICEIEAMKHKHKPVYGVQFHPEVSGEIGKKILSNFLKICKEL